MSKIRHPKENADSAKILIDVIWNYLTNNPKLLKELRQKSRKNYGRKRDNDS